MKIEELKLVEIKKELLSRGLSTSGNRSTLLLRLLNDLKKKFEDIEHINIRQDDEGKIIETVKQNTVEIMDINGNNMNNKETANMNNVETANMNNVETANMNNLETANMNNVETANMNNVETANMNNKETANMNNKETADMMSIIEEINKNTSVLPDLLSGIQSIKENLTGVKIKITDIEEEFKKIVENTEEQGREIDRLKKENVILKEEISQAKIYLNRLDQYSRKCNIEIQGIPIIKNELESDLLEIMIKLSNKLKINFKKEYVEKIHRLHGKSLHKSNIIVAFKDSHKRDLWLEKRKSVVTIHDILNNNDATVIYINNNLTPENKVLLWNCKNFAREYAFKYCWYSNGKIMLRKDNNEKAIIIKSIDDLTKLKRDCVLK